MKTFSKSIVAVLVIMILFPSYALGRSVTPMYEDLTGYEFVPGKVDTLTPSLSFNHDAENASDLPDEAEFWTTRTKSSSTTAHVDVTLKGLAAELEFGLETEWGTSTEVRSLFHHGQSITVKQARRGASPLEQRITGYWAGSKVAHLFLEHAHREHTKVRHL